MADECVYSVFFCRRSSFMRRIKKRRPHNRVAVSADIKLHISINWSWWIETLGSSTVYWWWNQSRRLRSRLIGVYFYTYYCFCLTTFFKNRLLMDCHTLPTVTYFPSVCSKKRNCSKCSFHWVPSVCLSVGRGFCWAIRRKYFDIWAHVDFK